ncbi:hypothetical protein HYZ41_02400 [archaeon]|nr:hypothetical protein [archaeon]
MFYDLHVHTNISIGENTLEETAEMAKRLGLGGIGVVQYYPNYSELPLVNGIDVVKCTMIKANNVNELSDMISKARNRCEVLMVHGGDYDINRAACENSMVDVLCHPELGRKDSGFDHICAKAANENNVAVEVNFREIMESYKKNRIYILSAIKKNVTLYKKYDVNIVTASGAVTKWGLRSGRELSAITNMMGLDLGHAIDSSSLIPENIVSQNREKLAGKRWQGAQIVE